MSEGFNNSYSLGWDTAPRVGMTVYETSPALPGVIVEVLGLDPKYVAHAHFYRVRVHWLGKQGAVTRSSRGLHDLDARIDDFERQLREMVALRSQLHRA